jgi:hypothetical protein
MYIGVKGIVSIKRIVPNIRVIGIDINFSVISIWLPVRNVLGLLGRRKVADFNIISILILKSKVRLKPMLRFGPVACDKAILLELKVFCNRRILMYKLLLTKEERKAINWIGDRYRHGNDLYDLLMSEDVSMSADCSWDDDCTLLFKIPEHIAWNICEIINEGLDCFNDSLCAKLHVFNGKVVWDECADSPAGAEDLVRDMVAGGADWPENVDVRACGEPLGE